MATMGYLAMTSAEFAENRPLPPGIGWMSCHFSGSGAGLTDLPEALPEGSLLILDDSRPIKGHHRETVAGQLKEQVKTLGCCAVLLDFQRPGCQETAELVKHLLIALPCPVVVSDVYARELDCPVFLPPVPPSVTLKGHLAPWGGREIWLEMGLDGEEITLTEQGSIVTPLPRFRPPEKGHRDGSLNCHYTIAEIPEGMRFTLWRTREDRAALLKEAEKYGVTTAVGLWQEFSNVGLS